MPEARAILIELYQQILNDIKPIPETYPVRFEMERDFTQRLWVLLEEEDTLRCEMEMNEGQLEDLIEEAKDQITLIPQILEHKPWEHDKWQTAVIIHSHEDIST